MRSWPPKTISTGRWHEETKGSFGHQDFLGGYLTVFLQYDRSVLEVGDELQDTVLRWTPPVLALRSMLSQHALLEH